MVARGGLPWMDMGPPPLTFGLPSCLLPAGIHHGLLPLQLSNEEAWRGGHKRDPGFPGMTWMPFFLVPGPWASRPVLPSAGTGPWPLNLPRSLGPILL